MPAAFQSSYTPIAAAGTESQIRHLSRMIATQLTSLELGPGVEMMRNEKRKQFIGGFRFFCSFFFESEDSVLNENGVLGEQRVSRGDSSTSV